MRNDRIEELLERLVQLQRVQVHPVAKSLLEDIFFEDGEPRLKRVRVYARLDGSSQSKIAEQAGVSQPSVSAWTRDWKRVGLVSQEGKAVFDILDFFPELNDEI